MRLKIITKKYINCLIISLFFISYFFFFLSLEKCFKGEDICCIDYKWMKKKVKEEVISSVITIILLELMLLKKISKFHLLHLIIVYTLFYSYSNGIKFDDHGFYNIKYFLVIIITSFIFLLISNFIFFSKNKKIIFLYFVSFLTFLYILGMSIKKKYSCDDWKMGLNNTSIDNRSSRHKCLIKIPKFCPYKLGKFFLDFNRISSFNCDNNKINPRKLIIEKSKSPFINKNTLHIGFPLINQDDEIIKNIYKDDYFKFVYNNYIDMNNLTLINLLKDRKPEVSIDFSKNKNGKMEINLQFNRTLSKERKKLEGTNNPYSKNIIIIYLDSVSRAYSIRQLKKTLKFFENFMSYHGNSNSKFSSENFHSFQFFKYHSHRYYTPGNFPILFYGNHRNKTNKHINLYFKKNGYVTGYTADNCYKDFAITYHNFSTADKFDHLYIVCDPNYIGPTPKLNCYYNKLYIQFMIEYANQFWRKYNDNQKFFMLASNFPHEGSLEKLKYIDKIIYNFIYKLFKDNMLAETSILLVSDHGIAIPSIYYLNDFFNYEKVLPMFYMFVNDRKNCSYELQYNYLNENQQTFITAFDIHNTIIHLLYGDKYESEETKDIISKNGKSLFTKIDSMSRSPKNYYSMDENVCI